MYEGAAVTGGTQPVTTLICSETHQPLSPADIYLNKTNTDNQWTGNHNKQKSEREREREREIQDKRTERDILMNLQKKKKLSKN